MAPESVFHGKLTFIPPQLEGKFGGAGGTEDEASSAAIRALFLVFHNSLPFESAACSLFLL
jgi:hypothetical protein